MHTSLHSFEVSKYHLFVFFFSDNNEPKKIASFTVKRSFSRLQSMSEDGMSKDGRKMSPVHVTLRAVVKCIYT